MSVSVSRATKETKVEVELDLYESGRVEISTGYDLLDELLTSMARAGKFSLVLVAQGDWQTGDHHTVEDVGITLGLALSRLGLNGTGSSTVPCGQALATAALSFGQPAFRGEFAFAEKNRGGLALENVGHFMRSLAYQGGLCLYLQASGGDDLERLVAMMKALGRALSRAARDS
ncbi:MAG: imidazoleglycerol-phosphate dehydratase [Methanosaeta sp. PtaB.Bin039]|nr:MAG: imidazoleglycerol-phosphate dehydratase [Methanosaeta sp. PtaB.Bin039]OPY47480.1 MAG: imidazoleglycerol-phosphate dehydratase [Methanosaeta sp. PtaU1.Bin028]